MSGKTTADGYGWRHQQERERWRSDVEAGLVDCWRCVERIGKHQADDHSNCNPDGCERDITDPLIHPWQPWDLGHDDTDPKKRRYKGPEHRYCNRAAGARKGRRGWTWRRNPRRDHQELSVDPADL